MRMTYNLSSVNSFSKTDVLYYLLFLLLPVFTITFNSILLSSACIIILLFTLINRKKSKIIVDSSDLRFLYIISTIIAVIFLPRIKSSDYEALGLLYVSLALSNASKSFNTKPSFSILVNSVLTSISIYLVQPFFASTFLLCYSSLKIVKSLYCYRKSTRKKDSIIGIFLIISVYFINFTTFKYEDFIISLIIIAMLELSSLILKLLPNSERDVNIEKTFVLILFYLISVIVYFKVNISKALPLIIVFTITLDDYLSSRNKRNTVVFICSSGGHLAQMMKLEKIFIKYDGVLVTEYNDVSKHLDNKKYDVEFLEYGSRFYLKKYFGVFFRNTIKTIRLIVIYKPKVVVSTGTHTAIPMFYLSKILYDSKLIYIESYAKQHTGNLAGRIAYPISDTFIVQWESMLDVYKNSENWGGIY